MIFIRVSQGLFPLDFGNLKNGLSTATANGNSFWGGFIQRTFLFFSYTLTLIVSAAATTLYSWACDKFCFFFVLLLFFPFPNSVCLFPFRISRQKITRHRQQRACNPQPNRIESKRGLRIGSPRRPSQREGGCGSDISHFLFYFYFYFFLHNSE